MIAAMLLSSKKFHIIIISISLCFSNMFKKFSFECFFPKYILYINRLLRNPWEASLLRGSKKCGFDIHKSKNNNQQVCLH